MSRFYTFFGLALALLLLNGCQPPKEDLAVKTETDYFAEAAARMAEKPDFQYDRSGYKQSSYVSFRFNYPRNWSVPVSAQVPEAAVVCVRNEAIDNFTPNFVIVVEQASGTSADLLKMTKRQCRNLLREGSKNFEILDFEHGKFQDRDVVYLHSQKTIDGVNVEQFMYIFFENGREVALCLTSSRPITDAVKEEFDAILGSFKAGSGINAE